MSGGRAVLAPLAAFLLLALSAAPGVGRAAQAVLVLYAPDGPLAAPGGEVLRPSGEFADRLAATLRRAGLEPVFAATPRSRIAALLRQENRPFTCALFAEPAPAPVPDFSVAPAGGTSSADADAAPEASAPEHGAPDRGFSQGMRPGGVLQSILSRRIPSGGAGGAGGESTADAGVPERLRTTLPLLRGPRPVVAVRAAEAEALRARGSLDALLADGGLRVGLVRRRSYGPDLDARLLRYRPPAAVAKDDAGLAELLRSGRADYAPAERAAMAGHLSGAAGSTLFPGKHLELIDFPDLPGGRIYRLGFTRSTPPDAVTRVDEALGAAGGR